LISIHRIRNDVFGNYVIQKLFELGTSDIKSKLKQTLVGDVLSLSKTMYGCRVVQKALESLDNEDLPALIHEFKGSLIECILDPNGNHVVQKCIEVLSVRAKTADNVDDSKTARFLRQNCQFIFDTSLESLSMLSCHPFGCRVIQRIIENSVEPNFTRVLDTIAACHTQLLDDQYGNYVIQHLLQYGRVVDKETIMHTVLDSGLVKLSRQKYASNVIEKLLKYGTPTIRGMIIKDMLKEGGAEDGTAAVLLMVRDAYANYVVQTALDVAPEGNIKRHFVQELSKHSAQLVSISCLPFLLTSISIVNVFLWTICKI
jgi:pumilio RNA-binding family